MCNHSIVLIHIIPFVAHSISVSRRVTFIRLAFVFFFFSFCLFVCFFFLLRKFLEGRRICRRLRKWRKERKNFCKKKNITGRKNSLRPILEKRTNTPVVQHNCALDSLRVCSVGSVQSEFN